MERERESRSNIWAGLLTQYFILKKATVHRLRLVFLLNGRHLSASGGSPDVQTVSLGHNILQNDGGLGRRRRPEGARPAGERLAPGSAASMRTAGSQIVFARGLLDVSTWENRSDDSVQ